MVDDDEQTTDRRRTGQGGSEEKEAQAMEKKFKDPRSLPNTIEKKFEVLHGVLKDHETEYVLVMTPLLMLEIYTFQK